MTYFPYVIHVGYGGFSVPQAVCQILGCRPYDDFIDGEDIRFNETLIEWVKAHKAETELRVVYVPDCATDWMLEEYDGAERVLYVENGHIYFASQRV